MGKSQTTRPNKGGNVKSFSHFRVTCILVIVAVAGALLSVLPAAAEVPQPPQPEAKLTAHATDHGLKLLWHNAPRNAATFDVYRTAGEETVKLTEKPVRGGSFIDTTAAPSTTYTYSVKVASVRTPKNVDTDATSPRATVLRSASVNDEVGRLEVTTAPAKKEAARVTRSAYSAYSDEVLAKVRAERSASGSTSPSSFVAPSTHIDPSCQMEGTVVTPTVLSPTDCPAGYLFTGDVLVTATVSLTVDPGTTIYFATSTVTDTAGGNTGKVDLIVDGTLDVNGTGDALNRVTFTSVATDDTDGDVTPTVGDWGWVLMRPTSTANSIMGADFTYGDSVIADETVPEFTNNSLALMSGSSYNDGVVDFNNPAGTVTITDNTVDASSSGTPAIYVYSDEGSPSLTLVATGNTLTGYYGLLAVDETEDENASVASTITDNVASVTSEWGFLLLPLVNNVTSTATGSATVSGAFDRNVVTGSGGGVFFFPVSEDGDAVHTVSYADNDINTSGPSALNLAIASTDDGTTGNATIAYPVDRGTYRSTGDDSWIDIAVVGDSGDAFAAPIFNDATLRADGDYGLVVGAYAVTGTTSATPSLLGGTLLDGYDGGYVEAESLGNALSWTTLDNSSFDLNDDGLYGYANSESGWANAGGDFTDSNLQTDGYGLYFDAYSNSADPAHYALASPALSNVNIDSYYEGLYTDAYNEGEGPATSSPVLTNARLTSDDDGGMQFYVTTDGAGDAIGSPILTNSTIFANDDDAFYSYIYGYGNGRAVSEPVITNSTLRSYYYDAFDVWTYSYGTGESAVRPTVTNSTIRDVDDDYGIYSGARAYGSADAQWGGTFTDSIIRGYYEGFDVYVRSDQLGFNAWLNPTLTNTAVIGDYDYGFYGRAYAYGGSAFNVPVFNGGSITAGLNNGYEGLYLYSEVLGGIDDEALTAPTVEGTPIRGYYGVYLEANDDDTHAASSHVSGTFNNGLIEGRWGEGFYGYAYSGYSTSADAAVIDTQFSNMNIESDDDGIYAEAYTSAYGIAGATNMVNVWDSRVESFFDDAIELYTYANPGSSMIDTTIRRNGLPSGEEGIDIEGNAYSGDDSTVDVTIVDNNIVGSSEVFGAGIDIDSNGNDVAALSGTIASNRLADKVDGDEGIDVYAGSSNEDNFDLLIAGNTISGFEDEGIEVDSGGNTAAGDVVRVVDNVISQTGEAGIDVDGVIGDIRSNVQSQSGLDDTSDNDNAGILYGNHPSGAPLGRISCNTVSGNRFGVRLVNNDPDEDPVVVQNNFKDVVSGLENSPWDISSDNTGTTDAENNYFGSAATVTNTNTGSIDTSPALTDLACRGGYVLDGWGGVHPYGPGVPAASGTGYWPGWDIARAIGTRANASASSGESGYYIDGWGGIHEFGGAPAASGGPYWEGWDIARDIVIGPNGVSGYVLDGWGGIHAWGGAPALDLSGYTGYTPGQDIAKKIALRPDGVSGYVLDGYGGIHEFGGAPAVTPGTTWPGWNIARDIVLNHTGTSGYVMDGWGGMHPFGGAAAMTSGPYWPNWDIANAMSRYVNGSAFVMDGWGGRHTTKSFGATVNAPTGTPYWEGWDIARDMDGQM